MSCGRGTFVKPLSHGFAVASCGCNCWSCPRCAPRRKAQVRDDILTGFPKTFITLTWRASRPENPIAARRIMGLALALLVKRVRRAWPACAFEYFVVVEITKQGFPHFHLLCRAPYIPQLWLSGAWRALVGAPVVGIEAVRTQEGAAGYLAKYLAKDPAKLGTGKRYWCSQGYRLLQRDQDEAPRLRAKAEWTIDQIEDVVRRLEAQRMIAIWRGNDFALVMPLLQPPEHPP